MLDVVDQALRERDELSLVTMVCAVLRETADGVAVTLASGGHPLPLRVEPGGAVEAVGRHGLLLGAVPGAERPEVTSALRRGDTLLFFTDGLADTPGASGRFGEQRLLDLVAASATDPGALVAGVLDAVAAFEHGDGVDDRAALALRYVGAPGSRAPAGGYPCPRGRSRGRRRSGRRAWGRGCRARSAGRRSAACCRSRARARSSLRPTSRNTRLMATVAATPTTVQPTIDAVPVGGDREHDPRDGERQRRQEAPRRGPARGARLRQAAVVAGSALPGTRHPTAVPGRSGKGSRFPLVGCAACSASDPPLRVLPKGRHRLSRGEVRASQRGRILAAVVDVVAERGYAETSVAAVVERAGVSSKAFYEHFAGKEACFLAAYDAGVEVLRRELGAVLDAGAPPAERVGRAIDRYLDLVAAQPAFARTFLIEVYGAGPRALERRLDAQRRFADAIAVTLGVAADPRARLACAALVGGVVALVTERVGSGAADAADGLRAPVGGLVADWLGLLAPAPAPAAASHERAPRGPGGRAPHPAGLARGDRRG